MKFSRRVLAFTLVLIMLFANFNFSGVALADSTLTLPAALTVIEEKAFYGSKSFTQVVLPDNVNEIGSLAFAKTSLTTINLPASLTYIADNAFTGSKLKNVTATSGTYAYAWAVNNGYISPSDVFYCAIIDGKISITGYKAAETDVTIPSKINGYAVTKIGDLAFLNCDVRNIKIPSSVKYISSNAFPDSSDLHVWGSNDTYAQYWCNNNGIPFNIDWMSAPSLTVAKNGDGVKLNWVVDELAAKYIIYEIINGKQKTLKTVGAVNTYSIESVSEGEHCYAVQPRKTINGSIVKGSISNYVYYIDPEILWKSISNVEANVFNKEIVVTWSAEELAEGYRVSEIVDGTTTTIGTTGAVTYYNIANVTTGNHTYVVEPYKTISGTITYGTAMQVNATVDSSLVESITLNKSYVQLEGGGNVTLKATVSPTYADNKSVTWSSDNTDVATVTSAGKVTAKSSGTATITATAKDGSGVKASCVVEVSIETPYLTVSHPTIGDVLNAGEIEMFNGAAHQTWTVNSNYPVTIETVGDWFYDKGLNTFDAGQNTYIIYMDDGAPAGIKRTGKVKFYINNSLFVTVDICQNGGTAEDITPDPTITVHHPILGDIFEAGTFEMYNGAAHQTWTVTSNCNWMITKSGTWFSVDKTSGSAGTDTIVLTMADGASAGETRTGSVTFKVNGSTYKTVNFKQVGPDKALTVTHELLGDIIAASPVEMYNGAAHQTWTVTSNADWTLKTTGTWYSVNKTSGSAGTSTIILTFPDGADPGETRTGTLKFYFGSSLYATIKITQDGGVDTDPTASISVVHPWIGDVIDAGSANLSNSSGQSMNWTVFANYDWTITTSGSWFTVSPTSGSANTKTNVKITTTSYASSGYNTGSIIFKKGSSKKATITLYQGEGYDPSDYDDSFTVNHPYLGNVLDQDTIYMHNGSSYQTWTVVSNVDWSLTKSGSWFTVSTTSGSAKTSTDVKLTFTSGVAAGESREGYVKFSYYINGRKKTSTVYIAQDGGPADPTPETSLAASHALLGDVFEASPIEMHNGSGAEQNWTITSNKAWSITKSGDWFTVSPTSGSANTSSNKTTNVKITITDYARPGNKNSGSITFYVDGTKYKTVNIYQDGGESAEPSMTLGSAEFGNVFTANSIVLDNSKKTYTWALQSNTAWSVTKSGSWFSVTPTSGTASADSTTSFKVTVNTLPTTSDLTGTLTFKLDGSTYKTVNLKIPYTGTITPTDDKLAAPTNLKASVTSATSAKLTWNAVPGASGYNVYRSTNATTGYTKLNSSLVTSPYTDSTMKAGVNYYYIVEAVNNSGISGSASIPCGPVSYNAACALTISSPTWSPAAAGASQSFTIGKHGSNDYSVSIVQYNSAGKECTNKVTSTDHTLAKWLNASKSGTTLTLTAAKNYASFGKTAVVTVTCGCGATHTITVNQGSGESAPASVSMKLDGSNGFTETSKVQGKATSNHLNYVLIPGDTITVTATGGNYARRLTVRILNGDNVVKLDQYATSTGSTGLTKTCSYTIPDGATGIYTINVYASNSTTAGDDAQWISASATIRVKSDTENHSSINYPYSKVDFSDEIWATLTSSPWNLSAVHAAAIMGNIEAESGYCPYNSQSYSGADDRTKYTFSSTDGSGFGLCQWTSSGRKAGLLSYATNKGSADLVWDFDTQMEYLKSELDISTLQSYTSLYEATEWFDIQFEKPDQSEANSWPGKRYAKALAAYKKYTGVAYTEPALNFSVTHGGTNVITNTGYKMNHNAAEGATGKLVVTSNYYWRLTQVNETVSGWVGITCPKLYYPNKTVNCVCGYAGTTTLTLKVNKVPAVGQTYSTTLVFEIYQNSHVTKKVPVTLTYTASEESQEEQAASATITANRKKVINHAKSWLATRYPVANVPYYQGYTSHPGKDTAVPRYPANSTNYYHGMPYMGGGNIDSDGDGKANDGTYQSYQNRYSITAYGKLSAANRQLAASDYYYYSGHWTSSVYYGTECTGLIVMSWHAADSSINTGYNITNQPTKIYGMDLTSSDDYKYARASDCINNSGHRMLVISNDENRKEIVVIEQTAAQVTDSVNEVYVTCECSYCAADSSLKSLGTRQRTYSYSDLYDGSSKTNYKKYRQLYRLGVCYDPNEPGNWAAVN